MPLDPSISLQVKPVEAPNPLDMLSKAAQTQYMMMHGNVLQQQMNSNVAMSRALSGAIQPDGTIDYGKAVAGMKDSPYAYNLPTMMGQLLDQQTKQVGLQQSQWNLARDKLDRMGQGLGALLDQPDIKPEDVATLGAQFVKGGVLDANTLAGQLSDMPSDPTQLRQWVQNHWIGTMKASEQLNAMKPNYMTMNNGASQDVRNINPFAVPGTPNFHFNNQMAPGDANSMVTIPATGPNTPPKMVTKEQAAQMAGGTAGGIVAGQAPGAVPYQTNVATNAAANEQDLQQRVTAGSQLMHNLQEQQQVLQGLRTGGGATWRTQAAQRLQAWGLPQGIVDSVAGGDLGAAQTAQKLMVQGAVSQMKMAMSGHQTEGQMNAFLDANPNLDKDPRALEKIQQFYQGVYKNDATQQQALNQWKKQHPGQDSSEFFSNWAGTPTNQAYTRLNPPNGQGKAPAVVRTGTFNGKKVVQYSDGSVRYAQ